jgi:hypothetical protein
MPQTTIINHGTWASLTFPVAESNLEVQNVKWKPVREKVMRKSPANKAVSKLSYRNPSMTISMEADLTAQSGLGSLAVGRAPAAALNNFTDVWREHDPEEGVIVLEDVEDSADINGDVPLSATFTFMHYPFVS